MNHEWHKLNELDLQNTHQPYRLFRLSGLSVFLKVMANRHPSLREHFLSNSDYLVALASRLLDGPSI